MTNNVNIERAKGNLEEGIYLIPEHMRSGIRSYVLHGIPGGSFMTAVLANDLLGAFGRADDINASAMRNWAEFVYAYLPATCHGSYDIVHNWKGLKVVK